MVSSIKLNGKIVCIVLTPHQLLQAVAIAESNLDFSSIKIVPLATAYEFYTKYLKFSDASRAAYFIEYGKESQAKLYKGRRFRLDVARLSKRLGPISWLVSGSDDHFVVKALRRNAQYFALLEDGTQNYKDYPISLKEMLIKLFDLIVLKHAFGFRRAGHNECDIKFAVASENHKLRPAQKKLVIIQEIYWNCCNNFVSVVSNNMARNDSLIVTPYFSDLSAAINWFKKVKAKNEVLRNPIIKFHPKNSNLRELDLMVQGLYTGPRIIDPVIPSEILFCMNLPGPIIVSKTTSPTVLAASRSDRVLQV